MSLKMEFGGYKGTGPRVRLRRRAELGRRLTRRLSMVAKVPAALLHRANPPEPRQLEITAIAPDKSQLTVSTLYTFFFVSHSCHCFSPVTVRGESSLIKNRVSDRLAEMGCSMGSFVGVFVVLFGCWDLIDKVFRLRRNGTMWL